MFSFCHPGLLKNRKDTDTMNIKYMTPGELVPYDKNPRINDDAVDLVANSIQEFGFKQPIVADKDNVIIAGHTRWKAAKKLGLKQVPVIMADDLTPAQVKAYRLADNKVAEASEWDMDLLADELDDLSLDFDMSSFGFEPEDVPVEDVEEDNYEPDIPEEPFTKSGQIWQLGQHRLMVGDSTSANDVDKLCDGEMMDLCVTDPPYNVNISNTKGMTIDNDNMDPDSFLEFLSDAFLNMAHSLRAGGAFYVWYATRRHMQFEQALNNAGLEVKEQLIWNKSALVLGRQDYQWKHEPCLYGWKDGAPHYFINTRTLTTVLAPEGGRLDIDSLKKEDLKRILSSILEAYPETTVLDEKKPLVNDLHPTMKPIKLIARQVLNSSHPTDRVLDLFGGSGSTLIACEQTNRQCYMMEYDPRYADVIINRWEQQSGGKAVLLDE